MPNVYSTPLVENDYGHFDNEHTPEHPYCGDQQCWCHYNVVYHGQIQHPTSYHTAEQVHYACAFFVLEVER